MRNITETLLLAKKKYIFSDRNKFSDFLNKIADAAYLQVEWDSGAGEEWARLIDKSEGIVCMLHSKIGIAFVKQSFNNYTFLELLTALYVEYTENYSVDEWSIDLDLINSEIPEINWHSAMHVTNKKCFSLNDLYFSTI